MEPPRIFSVTEINTSIRGLLETQFPFVSVAGEIANLRQPFSGHLYFTLKDDRSQIKAVLFKMQKRYLLESPVDGQMVVCRGRISVYEPRGDYQLIVDAIDFHGTGALQMQFEQLKKKLAAEGLFDEKNKQELPFLPSHVTLITSPKGAAVHDFIRVARVRSPQVRLAVYPVAVQGKNAATEIADALGTVNSTVKTDIIVLCRGGGSLEDLGAFNEEILARAIAASGIPVVNAVGHEIDFTIADFVADLRAPTPSAAAEMILPETRVLRQQTAQLAKRMIRVMSRYLDHSADRVNLYRQEMTSWRQKLERMLISLDHMTLDLERAMVAMLERRKTHLRDLGRQLRMGSPAVRLRLNHLKLQGLQRRLLMAKNSILSGKSDSLSRAAGLLDAVSPLATLARGYSIVRKKTADQSLVTDYRQVAGGDKVGISLHKGFLDCRVEKTGESRVAENDRKDNSEEEGSVEE